MDGEGLLPDDFYFPQSSEKSRRERSQATPQNVATPADRPVLAATTRFR